MGTAPATAKIRTASCQPDLRGWRPPSRSGQCSRGAPTPHRYPAPAAPHRCALRRCLTQSQLRCRSPRQGSTVPSPAGMLGGLLAPAGRQQGTGTDAGEDRAEIALRWQEERVTSPGCPRGTGWGEPGEGPACTHHGVPASCPRGRGARGSCHRGPRSISKRFAFVFLLQLQIATNFFSSSHFLISCRFAGEGRMRAALCCWGGRWGGPAQTPPLLQTGAAGAGGHQPREGGGRWVELGRDAQSLRKTYPPSPR